MNPFWRDVQARNLPIDRCTANAVELPEGWPPTDIEHARCEMIAGHHGPHVSHNLRWDDVNVSAEPTP